MKTFAQAGFKKIGLIFLLICIFYNSASTQVISGTVYCSETKESLPFPSIKLKNKSYHRVYTSDENGKFKINSDSIQQDTLLISYLGYESTRIPVSELKEKNTSAFYLKKNVFLLNQVNVIEDSEIKFLGKAKKQATTGWRAINKKGTEHGVIFKNNKKLVLKKICIPVRYSTCDTICVKLNIYNITDILEIKDRPKVKYNKFHKIDAENVLKESIYFEFGIEDIENAYVYVDISQFNAIVEGDFLVSIELAKELTNGYLRFNAGNKGRTFARGSKEKDWASIGIKMAMRIGVKEYSK